MKNLNSIVTATCTRSNSYKSSLDDDSKSSSFNDFEAPIIRLKLDKPLHWDWELTTSSSSSLPIIQLLNKNGKLMVETSESTAQRARGSFRKGLTRYEEFPLENKIRSRSRSRIKTSSSFSYSGDSNLPSQESVKGFKRYAGSPTIESNGTRKTSSSFSFSPNFLDSKSESLSNDKTSNGTTSSTSTEHFSKNRPLGNRNADGFSTKFGTAFGSCGYKPLKSKSEIIVRENDKGRRKKRIKKRFSGELEDIRQTEESMSKQPPESIKRNNEQSNHFQNNKIPNDCREFNNNNNLRNSTVKRSNTFKIIDGSEKIEELEEDRNEGNNVLMNKSNEDIARDYFKRVYELLKKKKEEKILNKENQREDSSSSFDLDEEMKKRRLRRKKRERGIKVEERSNSPQISKNEGKSRKLFSKSKELQSDSLSFKINEKERKKEDEIKETPQNAINQGEVEEERPRMGSNLSRHNSKGLNGRRTQSSGNLCDSKGKLNSMGKMLVPCSSGQRERYKLCGSLPNHLDDKINIEVDNLKENNNIMTDTLSGNLGGTLPNKKRSVGVHFMDHGSLDLVKHRSQDDLDENDPWRYHQSDLDLLKPRRASSTANRRKTPNVDSVSTTDSFKKYKNSPRNFSETSNSLKYQRNSTSEKTPKSFDINLDFDLVGTIPKRKTEEKTEEKELPKEDENLSIQDSDLLMKIVHKPDCELVKHRQQLSNSNKGKLMVNKSMDLRINKLVSKETQDQGYASEKSPEEEHLPSLPGEGFPNITPESTFRVTLQKSSRGLGLSVSGGGTAGPVRVKRLFPQQPAALSNKLQPGDILLAANGIPLTGLTNYEALEVLRTTPNTVELVVCRLPGEDGDVPPPVAPPPPPRRENLQLNPLPPLQIEPCGEFDIEMTKVGGSLGFTLRKTDSSALGHYVRALVREPALSDGRIKPGDKIVAVDGAPLSPMSHAEAVRLLRQCGPTVKLRLYRDLAQTPVAALSPTEDYPSRTSLRQEAVDMLCDLAVRKLSPGASTGSSCKQAATTSNNSPRKVRRLTTKTPDSEPDSLEQIVSLKTSASTSNQSSSDFDQCSTRTQITVSQASTPGTDIIDPPLLYHVSDSSDSLKTPIPKKRPSFLNLSAPQDKPNYQFLSTSDPNQKKQTKENPTTEIEENEAEDIEDETDGTKYLEEESEESECLEEDESNVVYSKVTKKEFKLIEPKEYIKEEESSEFPSEPASMPPLLNSANGVGFSYKNPAYQSANPAVGGSTGSTVVEGKGKHCSDQDIPGKVLGTEDPGGSKGLLKWKGVMFAPDDEGDKKEGKGNEEKKQEVDTMDSAKVKTDKIEQGTQVFMVELTRGWNSRLGFSLQSEGNYTVISVVHPDSVASKDGRLKQGDVLMMVNDESVEDMSTADIIDLLRKIRGSIGITVMRRTRRETS